MKATFLAMMMLLLVSCQDKKETSGIIEIHPDKFVETHSEGEEPFRRVVVTLKK